MANHSVNITTYQEPGTYLLGVSPSSLTVVRGDTITFSYENSGGPPVTVAISGFTTSTFTNSTQITLTFDGDSEQRTVRTDATLTTVNLTVSAPGFTSKNVSITITSGIDDTPDAFSFINIPTAQPSSVVESNTITLSGFNVNVNVSLTNGASYMRANDGVWRTTGLVASGETLKVRLTAAGTYNTAKSTTVTVGNTSTTWTVTTANDPGSGTVINFPVQTAGTVKLSDIKSFFGGSSPPNNLRSYLKGGAYVPNITKNAGVPSSGTITLQDFIGSGTALYYVRYPASRTAAINTIPSGGVVSVNWDYSNSGSTWNPIIGFGSLADNCQYRYKVTVTSGAVTSSVPSSVGVWSAWGSTKSITLSFNAPSNSESSNTGYVDFQVRSIYNTAIVTGASANYALEAYGP